MERKRSVGITTISWYFIMSFVASMLIIGNGCSATTKEMIYPVLSISPDDKYIAFAYSKNDKASIYIAKSDGAEVKRLTYSKDESCFSPVFSPDGNKILFLSRNIKNPNVYICIMNIDGSNIVKITKEEAKITEAIFSPDGTKIYFLQSNYYGRYSPLMGKKPHDFDIYEIKTDGSGFKRITNRSSYFIRDLSIFPAGKKLLFYMFEGNNKFYVLNLDAPDKITPFMPSNNPSPSGSYYYPQLAPDGNAVAFIAATADVHKAGRYGYINELFVMDVNTKQARQITFLKSCELANPCFFHTQAKIIFRQNLNWSGRPEYQVMQIDTDGSNLKKINLTIPE